MSSIQALILEKLQKLTPEKQGEVLHFIESLQPETRDVRSTPRGTWTGEDEITEEDITQARREMWGNFPREIE